MDTNLRSDCPECGAEVEAGMAACGRCGQELSWPGQERRQKSFARPDQELWGCFLIPLTSLTAVAILVVLLAGAFTLLQGRYGSLIFGLAAIWLIASWLKRASEDRPDEEEGE